MTPDQFARLMTPAPAVEPAVLVRDLEGREARTLMYGYDSTDRATVHIYLGTAPEGHDLAGQTVFFVVRYAPNDRVVPQVKMALEVIQSDLPTKRAYPEACDYEFGCKLREAGLRVTYTTFNPDREPAQFHGKLAEQVAA